MIDGNYVEIRVNAFEMNMERINVYVRQQKDSMEHYVNIDELVQVKHVHQKGIFVFKLKARTTCVSQVQTGRNYV